ncbi:hypothetical protein [Bacillus sp. FSL W8-0183]|uniref:hypothetical protein n=1 Tax=Bacillus sp. FSL W8-0183 TaxID=2954568 RepID=UPI000D03AB48|nr:hypothetical protein C6X98_14320 [Bacillus pumilus]HBU90646.1 hypothetical protein [Bacillus pumilus]
MKYEGYQKFAYICFSILVPLLSFLASLYFGVAFFASFMFVLENEFLNFIALIIFVFGPFSIIFVHIGDVIKKDSLLKRIVKKMCDLEQSYFYIGCLFLLNFVLLHNAIAFVVDWWNR